MTSLMPSYGVTLSAEGHQNVSVDDVNGDPYNIIGQLGGYIVLLMVFAGIVGNSLVLAAIIKCPTLHRSYNAFIASLSATDLVFNLTVMPFYADTYFRRKWIYSSVLCQWHTYFGTTVVIASAFHIAVIATSRYHVIVKPRFYAGWMASGRTVAAQIGAIWLMSFALVLPGIVGVLPVKIAYSDQLSRCNYFRKESRFALDLVFGAGFIIPCGVMCFCYAMIWRYARQSRLRMDHYGLTVTCSTAQCQRRLTNTSLARAVCGVVDLQHIVANDGRSTDPPTRTNWIMMTKQDDINGHVSLPTVASTPVRHTSPCDGVKSLTGVAVSAETSCGVLQNTDCEQRINAIVQINQFQSNIVTTPPDDDVIREPDLYYASTDSKLHPTANSMSTPQDVTGTRQNEVVQYPDEGECPSRTTDGVTGRTSESRLKGETTSNVIDIYIEYSPATSWNDFPPTSDYPSKISNETNKSNARVSIESSGGLQVCPPGVAARRASFHVPVADMPTASVVRNSRASCSIGDKCNHTSTDVYPSQMNVRQRRPTQSTHSNSRSHSLRMIMVVFLAYVVTYLPFSLTNLLDDHSTLGRNVYMITSLAFWAGSCVNPVIYGIMNRQFRSAYYAVVFSCACALSRMRLPR